MTKIILVNQVLINKGTTHKTSKYEVENIETEKRIGKCLVGYKKIKQMFDREMAQNSESV